MKRVWKFALLLISLGAGLSAQVEFGNLRMNQESKLLFTATTQAPQFQGYSTGFLADLNTSEMRQLSFFPEHLSILRSSNTLQIQNRFGVFRSKSNYSAIEPVLLYPSFVEGSEIRTGKTDALITSPDGRWITYHRRTSTAFGNLILVEVSSGKEFTVSNRVELSLTEPMISWSPESDFFMYHKGNKIYYFSIEQYINNRLLSEEFRSIGSGQLSSIFWGSNNELYYISGSLVYKVLGVEFFTRSLYQEFLKIGNLVGSIPFNFDPSFDRFWINQEGTQLLLDKGGRSVYLYFLQNNDFSAHQSVIQLPYLLLPRNTRVTRVLWSNQGIITLLTQSLDGGRNSSTIYRLNTATTQDQYQFQRIEDPTTLDLVLSPQGEKAALLRLDRVEIRNYQTWNIEKTILHTDPLNAVFLSEQQLIIAGSQFGELVNLQDNTNRFLFFSQIRNLGFSQTDGGVTAIQGPRVKTFDQENNIWLDGSSGITGAPQPSRVFSPIQTSSPEFRVYLENLTSGSYQNMIMVRNIRDVGTLGLFDPPVTRFEPFPIRDDTVSFNPFLHGSRIRRREVSLVLNAIDSVEGLTTILSTLKDYNVRATFFVNGDFIRRNPGAVQEIAESGHEVGNLFTVYFDMADTRYQITNQFIRQGLARNEDEYYEATGKELSLLWHAPYYFTSPTILQAGSALNYTYIGRDVDSLDWVPKRDATGLSRLYFPSAELVESVIERKKPGSIITMTLGRPGDDRSYGGRDDYLFNKLDILLNGLIERGYSVEPVSTLMDRAR